MNRTLSLAKTLSPTFYHIQRLRAQNILFEGWHVEDSTSPARFVSGKGIVAASHAFVKLYPTCRAERKHTAGFLTRHLSREDEAASPLVSVYSKEAAKTEALRRVSEGRESVALNQVLITMEDAKEYGGVWFRNVNKWIKELRMRGAPLPPNADDEFLFLHFVPMRVLRKRIEVVEGLQSLDLEE
ncbi:uncharacterized protein K452DRAFT_287516 [Aplosporella prunicola CBS 121167]|uniref:Uncharacterized protein n=1 Tax=Aplosporella prunicola CBS 121167 TaxID=1176127 RepID=A0A6A6BGA6_9PEZI|nr:uncharacterized protein K452DRAFT_287516 [Aplosporella prunicola CBS 121167]KAF2141551.1 hypothetical protein K452DRAFT_287516 [Aplosporella prunicola CBS 121167]